MEILRLLRMSLTTPVLPPVGEDDARSDSTCSDDHAAVPGHECRSGISPERMSAGQTSESNAAAQDGQCYKEMPPATSQHIKNTTLAAPADSPLDTDVTPPPGHAYIDHDHIQHVTEPAPCQGVADGAVVHTTMAPQDVSSSFTHDETPTQQNPSSLCPPESAGEPDRGTSVGSHPFRSGPLSAGLVPSGSTHVACDGMQHNRGYPTLAEPQPGPDQAEYAFDQSFRLDLPDHQGEPVQSVPASRLDPFILQPHVENMFAYNPGSAIYSHLEDALGEGLDSWYESVEGAVIEPPAMETSPSMIDWDVWLERYGA
ncbi:hypothetical protein LTS02_018157 [Friedmanniomyces endolithicus]|nr:hypothetical protein LTS02_018157 [Friedmanniomyces endolithicus]